MRASAPRMVIEKRPKANEASGVLGKGQDLFQIKHSRSCGWVGHTLFLIPCLLLGLVCFLSTPSHTTLSSED